jgi:hypothetical protein
MRPLAAIPHALCLPVLIALAAGCAGPSVRTGETLAPGQFGMGVGVNFAIPDATLDDPRAAPIDVFNGFGFQYFASYGLPGDCEATVGFRVVNPFLEARCGLLQERRGQAVSLAPGAGVMWSFLDAENPLEVRGWVDVSKSLGGVFSPLMRVEYAYGPIFEHVWRGDRALHAEQGPYTHEPTRAGRLHVTLGGALHVDTGGEVGVKRVLVGVTPYWVLHTPDPDLPGEGWAGSVGLEFY